MVRYNNGELCSSVSLISLRSNELSRAVEGLPGLVLAATVFFFLPTHPHTYRWLTPRQREVAVARLQSESVDEGGKTGIDWSAVVYAFKDWKIYIIALMYSAMNVNLSFIGQSILQSLSMHLTV